MSNSDIEIKILYDFIELFNVVSMFVFTELKKSNPLLAKDLKQKAIEGFAEYQKLRRKYHYFPPIWNFNETFRSVTSM